MLFYRGVLLYFLRITYLFSTHSMRRYLILPAEAYLH